MAMPSFVYINDEESLIFKPKDKELVAYVPEKYFERGIAEQSGEFVNLFGIFDYTIQDLDTGKNNGLKRFNLPTLFSTKPSDIEKKKQIKLIAESEPTDYRIFRYREGDTIMVSTKLTQYIGNVEKFMNLFFVLGYIPNTIPYDKIHEYLMDNMALNAGSYGLNAQVFGFCISELCRSIEDPNIPWRLSKNSNVHAYRSMSIKNISKLVSPYTALLSEDFDESVMYAMMNDDPQDTSLEKIFVGNVSAVTGEAQS